MKQEGSPSNNNAIDDFLSTFTSDTTIKAYRSNLNCYFNWINIRPDIYVKSKRDFVKDVVEFEKHNTKLGLAPLTKKQKLESVKKFLEHHDIDIKRRIWRNINRRRKGRKPITIDKKTLRWEI